MEIDGVKRLVHFGDAWNQWQRYIFKRVVDALHYKPELGISALTTQDLRNIETIYKGLVENAPLHYKDRQNGFGYINLGNHLIKLVFYQVSEDMY